MHKYSGHFKNIHGSFEGTGGGVDINDSNTPDTYYKCDICRREFYFGQEVDFITRSLSPTNKERENFEDLIDYFYHVNISFNEFIEKYTIAVATIRPSFLHFFKGDSITSCLCFSDSKNKKCFAQVKREVEDKIPHYTLKNLELPL